MSKLLLFVILLSVIILGSYLNYPIENFKKNNKRSSYNSEQEDNGVTRRNYNKCIDNAEKKKCSSYNTHKKVIEEPCNPNFKDKDYIKKIKCDDLSNDQCYVKKLKRLCLNDYQDSPRGFGCRSDVFGETGYEPRAISGCRISDRKPNKKPSIPDRPGDYNKDVCNNFDKSKCDININDEIIQWKRNGIKTLKEKHLDVYTKWNDSKKEGCNVKNIFTDIQDDKCIEWQEDGLKLFKSKSPILYSIWSKSKPNRCNSLSERWCKCCEDCGWNNYNGLCETV